MTVVDPTAQLPVPAFTRARRWLWATLRSLWVVGVRDPVREGRLRLDSLSPVERQLARGGLVLLVLLLGSMLFAAAWRAGPLVRLAGSNELNLAPSPVIGLTFVALTVGWWLVGWGAMDAAPSVRLLVAVVFLVTMGTLADPTPVLGLDAAATRHGPTVIEVGYWATAGCLVASALLQRWGRPGQVVHAVLRPLLLVAVAATGLGQLWMHSAAVDTAENDAAAFDLDTAINNLDSLALPLVIVSAIVVVDLALDVASGLARPAARLRATWAAGLLAVLVAVKLWFVVGSRLDEWAELVGHLPLTVLRSALSLALLVALVAAVTRFPRSESFVTAKEKVIHVGSVLLFAPTILVALLFTLALTTQSVFGTTAVLRFVAGLPLDEVSRWWPLAAGLLAVAVGVWLMRRSRGGFGDELGSALLVVGGWNVPASVVSGFDVPIGLDYPTLDVLVTLAALGLLVGTAVRRGRVPAATSARLGALVVFSWLVLSQADYVATIGGLLGFSAVVVFVFGVLYSLASDSSFASDDSSRLPVAARPMLFVGYLLLSVTIVHWIEVTHEAVDPAYAEGGFIRIAIPLGAWLFGRRLLRDDDEAAAPAGEPEPVV